MADIKIRMISELRPCMIDDSEEALFHCWEEVSQIVPPSILNGGHSGGVVKETFAIVEFKNGRVTSVDKIRIRFLDSDVKFHEDLSFYLNKKLKRKGDNND